MKGSFCRRFSAARWLCCLSILLVSASAAAQTVRPDLTGKDLGVDGDGIGLSIALGPANDQRFSFFNEKDFSLRYVEAGRSTSVETALGSVPKISVGTQQIVSRTSLVLVNGEPRIFYRHPTTQKLMCASRRSGTWTKEVVDSATTSAGSPAAALCGTSICVSYYDTVGKNLRFAKGQPGSWSVSTVDASAEDTGAMSDIAVNGSGLPVVAYFDATQLKLKVAEQSSTGAWNVQVLPFLDRLYGWYPSIAIASNGTYFVSAGRVKAGLKQDLSVYYGEKKPGGKWELATWSDDYVGGETNVIVDSANRPRVASRYLRTNLYAGDAAGVQYAGLDGSGVWQDSLLGGTLGTSGAPYDISDVTLTQNPWGDPVVAYHYFRKATATTSALSAYRVHAPVDADNDGIPSARETQYGTNPNSADSDGDGLSDGHEVLVSKTSPTSASTSPTPTPTVSPTPAPTASPTPAAGAIRVNSGGSSYVDSFGHTWAADTYFVGGTANRTTNAIGGSSNDPLYQSERWGNMSYQIPVANGRYDVMLHFAEIAGKGPGERIFDVKVEGVTAISRLDIAKEVGLNTPLLYPLNVNVTDGKLDLQFVGVVNNAKISAIEVRPQTTSIRVNSGGASYVDSFGQTWSADQYFVGGTANVTTNAIAATTDDKLYQSERWGSSFSYSLPVQNGTYEVTLYFAEISKFAVGARVFDVSGEGRLLIDNLDIYKEAGANTPLIMPVYVTVSDGKLDLQFTGVVQNAKISAIEVAPY